MHTQNKLTCCFLKALNKMKLIKDFYRKNPILKRNLSTRKSVSFFQNFTTSTLQLTRVKVNLKNNNKF